jgi:hypothetical protein
VFRDRDIFAYSDYVPILFLGIVFRDRDIFAYSDYVPILFLGLLNPIIRDSV